ncbi:MAG: MFS transporter, partial [Bifidobacteriaceae bacterium]|nr:MFS transporter [Bifidobacteriaceae bacterium]
MRGYLQVLRLPGAGRMALAGAISRFPNAMQGIAIVLLIRALYKDWELAGLASGAMTISCAVCAPTVARLVDRFGQSRVGYPVIGAYCVIAASLVICALTHRPRPVLLGIALLFGACQFPVGAMTRARWTRLAGQGKSLQLSFSFESAVDDVAFMFGPTFATMLITAIHPAAGLIAAILLLVLGGSFFLSGRATEPPVRSRSEPAVGPSALRTPGVATVAAVFIAMGMGFGVSGIAVPALCDEWGHGWAPGLVLGLGSTASCLGAAFYGARSWRSPLWQRFVACVALQVGPSCLFLLAGNLPVLMVYSFLSGITISPSFINGNALVQRMVEPS